MQKMKTLPRSPTFYTSAACDAGDILQVWVYLSVHSKPSSWSQLEASQPYFKGENNVYVYSPNNWFVKTLFK